MAEILAFGVEKLWDLLIRESERFQGVKDQFDALKRDVNMLRCFWEDTYAKRHTSAMLMNNIQVIKEIVYDAEDIIENFLHKEELGKTRSTMKHVIRYSCGIVESRGISFDMESISKRISSVNGHLQILGVQQGFVNERERVIRTTFSTEDESDLVGLEENITKLVGYLEDEDSSQVVSIIGMGGLGKTTLARQVFNHDIVKERFEGQAWVCVSQEFTRKHVWQTILRQLRQDSEVSKMEEDELQGNLFGVLQTQKTLIVLDDIWKGEHWNNIKPIFPRKRGWKVLLTSHNESVALHADPTCFIFKPDCLNLEESWTLFQSQAFPREITITQNNEEMEKVGKEIMEHCGGLPLAIRVLGGMLAKKYTLDEWKRVSNDIGSYLMRSPDRNDDKNIGFFNYILSLSFEELPNYLKYCFLYLAHFPEDHQISVEKLSYYWAAEGIIKPSHLDGETFIDNGHSYIEELVRRNMVISERNNMSLRFETCHLHDMMREVCLYKANEENFLQMHGNLYLTANTQSRRYVLQNPRQLYENDTVNRKLRSLMIVIEQYRNDCYLSRVRFTMVPFLRVLDLNFTFFIEEKLHKSIAKLIYLRYLSLEGAHVRHLPYSLGKLKLLLYLNINVSMHSVFVPNVLMGMKELRYLALPEDMDEKTKLELSNQVNLETLINFSTKNSSLEDIHGMTRLRYLTMKFTRKASLETLYAVVAELRQLEAFDIKCDLGTIIEKRFFSNMVQLKYLRLCRMYMKRLVSENHFPSHLTCLILEYSNLEEDPMPILGKFLHLTDVRLLNEAFVGKRMVCSRGGFPQLQKLIFDYLYEWEEWIVEEGSMPLLHTLEIGYCEKLKELPHELSFSYSLKNLTISECGEEWKRKLSEGGEDYYKIKHIPSVTIFADTPGLLWIMNNATRNQFFSKPLPNLGSTSQ